MSFDELVADLRAAREQRLVYERAGPDGLVLYVYTSHCVFEAAWTRATIAARGLILDHANRRIVATPFPKFFNAGERDGAIPDLSFDATEKLDGSLIIIFHHGGRWRTATKGAFDSEQARWADAFLRDIDLAPLRPGVTYLAEATYPENRIVVAHDAAQLRLLAAYGPDGIEVAFADVVATGDATGLGSVPRIAFASLGDLMARAKGLPRSEEGYVLRFSDGLRLKVKGNEYKRIHALISGLTPLAMWEALAAQADMAAIRRDLPEEFWGDFDSIIALLAAEADVITKHVATVAREVEGLSDKDLGLRLANLDETARGFIFDYRKSGGRLTEGRSRDRVFRLIRPTGNVLAGYTPSFAITRVAEDSG